MRWLFLPWRRETWPEGVLLLCQMSTAGTAVTWKSTAEMRSCQQRMRGEWMKDKKKKIFPQISQDKAIPTVRRFICSSLQRSYGIAIMFLIQTWETLFILDLSGVCFLLLVADFSFLNLLFFVFLWISFSSFLSLFLIIVLFKCSK